MQACSNKYLLDIIFSPAEEDLLQLKNTGLVSAKGGIFQEEGRSEFFFFPT